LFSIVNHETVAKILVIDKSEQLLEMLSLLFKMNGHQVANSKGVVDTVKAISQFSPDLILLDAMLGHNSGKELCKEIKTFHPTVPIILMCTNTHFLEGCKECKADDFIEKPFDIVVLNNKINKLLAFYNIYNAR
jgi:DNA-binding response OmpR family regulator